MHVLQVQYTRLTKKDVIFYMTSQTVDKVAPEMRSGATFRVLIVFSLNHK